MAAKAQWEGHLHALESFQVWKWSCSYLHVCPIPKADGTLCGQKHPAKAHKGASLNSGLCFEAPLEPLPGDFSAPALPMVLDVLAYGSAVSFKVFIFLDIFSGATSPVSVAVRKLCADTTEPADLILGFHCDLLDEKMFNNVRGVLAAPYCSKNSMATLRPNGPKACKNA